MTFYLGKLGAVMAALPHPGRGIDPTLTRDSKVDKTIGGGQVVHLAPVGRRTYGLEWASLSPEQHSIVEEFQTGARGAGPYALLDPYRRNHLSSNQSSATSVDNTPDGFTPSTSETVGSSAALVRRGPRALTWTIPSSSTAGILAVDAPGGYTAWPTPALATWTYSAYVRGGGTDPIVTTGTGFVWLDATGATLSSPAGSTVATSSGAWTLVSQTATAPAGAVAYGLRHLTTPASVGAGGTVLTIDQPMLDMASTVRTWVLGTGIPYVSVTDAGTTYSRPIKRGASLALIEVG